MKMKNTEDIKECAMNIAEVRRTGLVNMFDRGGVIEVLEDLEHDFTAEYLKDNKDDYMELLKESANY